MINIKNNFKYNTVKQPKNELDSLDNFDWTKYIKSYDDLKEINNEFDAKKHWIHCGKKEKRKYFIINNVIEDTNNFMEDTNNFIEDTNKTKNDFSQKKISKNNFDWEKYVNYYDDLKNSGLKTRQDAWNHWLSIGIKENRVDFLHNNTENLNHNNKFLNNNNKKINENLQLNDNLQLKYINFDWKSYIHYYNDLLNIQNKNDAWNHWIQHGKKEGRVFCDINKLSMNTKEYVDFTWEDYISNYKDLSSYNTKQKAWIHWIYFGKIENRVIYNKLQKEKEDFKLIKTQEKTTKPLTNKLVDLKFKKNYNNYGTHYYGWKMVINQL
jgi:hypothetical protein